MAIGNPDLIFNLSLKGLTQNPAFSQLSPKAQAAFLKQVQQNPLSAINLGQNPDLQAAIAEAQQKGLMNNDPLWKDILKGTAIAGGVALAGPAIGSLAGSSTAAPGSTTLGDVGPLSADETFTAGPMVGETGLDLAGPSTTAVTTGFGAALKAALPAIIGAGTQLAGAGINASQQDKALAATTAANQASLAQALQIYNQSRADEQAQLKNQYALTEQQRADALRQYQQRYANEAPYRNIGASSLGALSQGLGLGPVSTDSNFDPNLIPPPSASVFTPAPVSNLPITSGTTTAPTPTSGFTYNGGPNAGVNVPSSLSALTGSQTPTSGNVPVKAPNGIVYLIPSSQVAAAQAKGGQVVGNG